MKSDDEKFLKEVLWSEAWFPWKRKNAIFVRGHERNSTEHLALILSALALIVSAIATIGTWKQTDLMQAQLTAAERNTGTMRLGAAIMASCRAIQYGPVRARKWKIYRTPDNTPAKIPVIAGKEFEISLEQREEYANRLEDVKLALHETSLYLSFLQGNQTKFYEKTISDTLESLDDAIDLVDNHAIAFDYVRLRNISHECYGHIGDALIERGGAKELSDTLELDDFSKRMLTPNPSIPAGSP